ncbi:MAG: hypothetical protein ACRDDY_04620 [Clostridium sp.]
MESGSSQQRIGKVYNDDDEYLFNQSNKTKNLILKKAMSICLTFGLLLV